MAVTPAASNWGSHWTQFRNVSSIDPPAGIKPMPAALAALIDFSCVAYGKALVQVM